MKSMKSRTSQKICFWWLNSKEAGCMWRSIDAHLNYKWALTSLSLWKLYLVYHSKTHNCLNNLTNKNKRHILKSKFTGQSCTKLRTYSRINKPRLYILKTIKRPLFSPILDFLNTTAIVSTTSIKFICYIFKCKLENTGIKILPSFPYCPYHGP